MWAKTGIGPPKTRPPFLNLYTQIMRFRELCCASLKKRFFRGSSILQTMGSDGETET
jgi:hypothetical protein